MGGLARTLTLAAALALVTAIVPVATPDARASPPTLLPCNPQDVAEEKYGSTNLFVEPLPLPEWEAAFPDHELYLVTDPTRLPAVEHTLVIDPSPCEGYDTTREFQEFALQSPHVHAFWSSDAVVLATAYAAAVDHETLGSHEVVTSEDSDRLGYQVEDPHIDNPLIGGWRVDVTTWQPNGGVLVNWSIDVKPGGVEDAKWYVSEVGIGPSLGHFEAPNLRENDLMVIDYTGLEYTHPTFEREAHRWPGPGHDHWSVHPPKETLNLDYDEVTSTTTFDGSTVSVQAPNGSAIDASFATNLANGLATTYDEMVEDGASPCAGTANPEPNWGLAAGDPDCTLEVRIVDDASLLCIACVLHGEHAVLYVSEHLPTDLANRGMYQDGQSLDGIATSLLGHLFLHHLQDAEIGWSVEAMPFLEGQAVAAQSLLTPSTEAGATSTFVGTATNGPHGFQRNPTTDLCSSPARSALFQAWVADTHGIESLEFSLGTYTDTGDCNADAASALAPGFDGGGTPSEMLTTARLDFTQANMLGNLQWGTHTGNDVQNWSALLHPLAVTPGQDGAYVDTGAFGIALVDLTGTQEATVTCDPADGYGLRLVTEDDGTVTTTDATCGGTLSADATADRVTLLGVRNGAEEGTVQVAAP